MKLAINTVVQCGDKNTYAINERTSENYMIGSDPETGNQRLFKPDGSYAGSDKAKSVVRIL